MKGRYWSFQISIFSSQCWFQKILPQNSWILNPKLHEYVCSLLRNNSKSFVRWSKNQHVSEFQTNLQTAIINKTQPVTLRVKIPPQEIQAETFLLRIRGWPQWSDLATMVWLACATHLWRRHIDLSHPFILQSPHWSEPLLPIQMCRCRIYPPRRLPCNTPPPNFKYWLSPVSVQQEPMEMEPTLAQWWWQMIRFTWTGR